MFKTILAVGIAAFVTLGAPGAYAATCSDAVIANGLSQEDGVTPSTQCWVGETFEGSVNSGNDSAEALIADLTFGIGNWVEKGKVGGTSGSDGDLTLNATNATSGTLTFSSSLLGSFDTIAVVLKAAAGGNGGWIAYKLDLASVGAGPYEYQSIFPTFQNGGPNAGDFQRFQGDQPRDAVRRQRHEPRSAPRRRLDADGRHRWPGCPAPAPPPGLSRSGPRPGQGDRSRGPPPGPSA